MNLRRSNFLHFLIRSVSYFIFRIVYRLKIEGRENLPRKGRRSSFPSINSGAMFRSSASRCGDPQVISPSRSCLFIQSSGTLSPLLGGVPIDRLKPVKSLDSFRYVEHLLQEGDFIVLYPEGTYYPHCMGRGKHRFIKRFLDFQEKKGRREQKPIPFVPMGIQFAERNFRSVVNVKIGKPLFAREGEEALAFTSLIMEQIAKLSGLPPLKDDRREQRA